MKPYWKPYWWYSKGGHLGPLWWVLEKAPPRDPMPLLELTLLELNPMDKDFTVLSVRILVFSFGISFAYGRW